MKLILLPGLDGTGLLFAPLLAHLPVELEPVTVAFPAGRCLGYTDLLRLVEERLPAGDPFVLLGESFSGPLALMAAARRPPGLQAVVLCATFIRCPVRWIPAWTVRRARPWWLGVIPLSWRLPGLVGFGATSGLRRLVLRANRNVQRAVMLHRLREVYRVDVTEELSSCPVPVFYLQAARDRVVGGWNLREMRRVQPRLQTAVLPVHHLLLQLAPRQAARQLSRWLVAVIPH